MDHIEFDELDNFDFDGIFDNLAEDDNDVANLQNNFKSTNEDLNDDDLFLHLHEEDSSSTQNSENHSDSGSAKLARKHRMDKLKHKKKSSGGSSNNSNEVEPLLVESSNSKLAVVPRKTIDIKLEDDREVMTPEVVDSSNYVDTMDSYVTENKKNLASLQNKEPLRGVITNHTLIELNIKSEADIAKHLPEGDSPEIKKQRRLVRNRLSAALHRERKRMMIDTLTATVSELERKLAQQTSDLSQLQLSLSTVMNEKETLQANLFAVQRFLGADLFEKVLSGTAGVSFDQNNTNQSSDNMTPELVPSSDCSMSSSHGSMTNSESLDVESSASLNGKKRRRTSSSDLKSPKGMLVFASMACVAVVSLLNGHSLNTGHSFGGMNNVIDGRVSVTTPLASSVVKQNRRRLLELDSATSSVTATKTDSMIPDGTNTRNDMGMMVATASSSSLAMSRSILRDEDDYDYFYVSPIENYPHLWNLESKLPWKSKRKVPLFDIRALMPRKPRTSVSEESSTTSTASKPQVGASFMFVPDAYANLSPGFLHLAGLNRDSASTAAADDDDDGFPATTSTAPKSTPMVKEYNYDSSQKDTDMKHRDSNALVLRRSDGTTTTTTQRSIPKDPSSKNQNIDMSLLSEDDPYMVMLLPASTFGVCSEGGDGENEDSSWVEMGVTVRNARLISGVDFVEKTNSSPLWND